MLRVQHMIKNGMEFEEIIFQQLPLVCSIHGMDINFFFLRPIIRHHPKLKQKFGFF